MRHHYLLILALCLPLSTPSLGAADVQALLDQSYAQSQAGQFDDALMSLQEAVEIEPNSSMVHTRLGGIRVLRKEYSEGIKDFQQAIMLDQTNASAFIGMAVAYLHMGQYSLAKASLDEAGKLDPSKKSEIDQVLSWIDQRTQGANVYGH